ncbi:MAG: UMP kinase [Flavobacteriales bacterium]|jgi:uridylate kinase|uniref:UMP kinase n=1 Tax=Blattabacterium sp. (Mastotermes darwiniensis) TaxID=39768 RepID=UPI000231DED9|nr:UMP kinase [Blattabacterium sp. (Mastotermes darwiniensis)]AER40781.1 uridylate kinase [Blattabacterium sp. (Mastotermes darwiniensis) str. MADAR]MDR1804626.1 UMP kinase [Flavobacteriales bacterium]
MKYKRSLLKLSGESLMGNNEFGLHSTRLQQYAEEVKNVVDMGAQVAIVIGGGNIFRGFSNNNTIDRIGGDYMGMLATVINGIALQSYLENVGVCASIQTAIRMDQIAEPFVKDKAIHHLEKGRVVIFVAGLGNPYFTTDTAAVLRAIEIKADVLLKGTRVDGIYTKDPEKDKYAKKIKRISFDMAYKMEIKVMDQTAFILGNENNLPIIIFDINRRGNFKKAISGEDIGTLVTTKKK